MVEHSPKILASEEKATTKTQGHLGTNEHRPLMSAQTQNTIFQVTSPSPNNCYDTQGRVLWSDIIFRWLSTQQPTPVVIDDGQSDFILVLFHLLFSIFYNCIALLGFQPLGNSGCFPSGQSAMTESRYPTYDACSVFSVSIIRRTLTWTIGSLTCNTAVNACGCTRGCWNGHRIRVSTQR